MWNKLTEKWVKFNGVNILPLTSIPVASIEADFVTNINHPSANQICLQYSFRLLATLYSLNICASCDWMSVPIFIQNPQAPLLPVVREYQFYKQRGYLARSPRICLKMFILSVNQDRLYGLVVRVPGYRSRGPEFDSRRSQIFWEIMGLERGPLSLVRIID
jgi:hypothetical protein